MRSAKSQACGDSYDMLNCSSASEKPMTPTPIARFSWSLFVASGMGSALMSIKLSRWRTVRRTVSSSLCQLTCLLSMWAARLTEARLQTATLSLSWGRQISVHKLDMWIVPVLLFRALKLIGSFQVSHGCEVDCKEVRIACHCSRAVVFFHMRSLPVFAISTYSQ